jgi:CRP-like cAMP-binding protein
MDYSLLSSAPLFKGLTPPEVVSILSGIHHRIRKFETGTVLFQSGETVNSLIVVIKGTLKGEMVDYTGKVIKIEDITAPRAIAPAFIFGKQNRFPVNVIAGSDGELLLIEKPDLLKLLMGNNIILVNFLDIISNRSQFLSEKIKFLNFKTIKGKLAHYILLRADNEKTLVRMDRTQNDLADYFGVARASVARSIGEMEQAGLIEAKGKNIRIIDRKGLAILTTD